MTSIQSNYRPMAIASCFGKLPGLTNTHIIIIKNILYSLNFSQGLSPWIKQVKCNWKHDNIQYFLTLSKRLIRSGIVGYFIIMKTWN